MACCHVLIVPLEVNVVYSPLIIKKSASSHIYPESLNGFQFGLIGRVDFNGGDEPLGVGELLESLHLCWKPSMTWRLTSFANGYYLVEFSCFEDKVKVGAKSCYSLKRGWVSVVGDWSPECHAYKYKNLKAGPSITMVLWHPPLPLWIKINTDGSARGCPGRSSCGGVFRDCRGKVVACFSLGLEVGVAFEAELQACIVALAYAHEQGLKKIWLESDNTDVVELLASRSGKVPRKYKEAWMEVLGHLEQMEFRVTHIYREGNRVADAQSGWWSHEIPSISHLVYLYQDSIGRVNTRIR